MAVTRFPARPWWRPNRSASIVFFYRRNCGKTLPLVHEASKKLGLLCISLGEFMETLLMVAVVVMTLAVVAQAGVLLGVDLLSRRIGAQLELLMEESRRLIAPLESITNNLKAVAEDLGQTAQIAREQVLRVQSIVNETRDNIRTQLHDVRERVLDTVDEARATVMRPIRRY